MKKTLSFLILALALGITSMDTDAAKRFGGGSNLGKQRATPTQSAPAPSQAQPAAPAKTPAAAPAGLPPPKPSFMQRWGGLLAGLGIGALLASMFGAQMGPIVGLLLAGAVAVLVIGFLMRLLTGRREQPAPGAPFERSEPSYDSSQARPQFSGIGSRVGGEAANDPSVVLGGPVEPFLRVAKTSFIRLQAANDAGDLDDIRDYTTPEMYAEIAMQLRDRNGEAQKTEIVSVDAAIADAAIEGDYAYASVRFWGLIREAPGANPEPFDEIWHVRRKADDPRDSWVIAGIQQAA